MALILEKKRVGRVSVIYFGFTGGIALFTIGSIELLGLNWFGLSGNLVAMVILDAIIRRLVRNIRFEPGLEELVWFAFTGGMIAGYDYIIIRYCPTQVLWYKLLIIGLCMLSYHAYYLWILVKLFHKEPGIHRKNLWFITRLHQSEGHMNELVIQ